MNIFEGLEKYRNGKLLGEQDSTEESKTKNIFDRLKKYAVTDRGIYRNEYTSRTYSTMCKDAYSQYEDAFDGELDATWNID
jgi:hypothetical protein